MSGRIIRLALAVALVAGVAAVALINRAEGGLAEEEANGPVAMRAARDAVPKILSYTDSGLAEQLKVSQKLMTDDYARRYEAMVKETVWPKARDFGVSNQLEVVRAGIVATDGAEVTVLIFANQTTRTTQQVRGVTQGTRLEVTMQRHDDAWLVDDIRPL